MAFSSNSPRQNGKRRATHLPPNINVTPLVDVMLVLLVIFMVTAPLLTVGVSVDLPKTNASPLNEKDEPLTITIDSQGLVYLQETPIELEVLIPRLIAITGSNLDARLYVRGDRAISYGRIMEVMGAINAAGFKKVALLTQLPSAPPPQPPK